jgi:hypothetical protein
VSPAAKLAGFLVLLAVIAVAARAAGAWAGPVTTSRSDVTYSGGVTGGSAGTGGPGTGGVTGGSPGTGGPGMGGMPMPGGRP